MIVIYGSEKCTYCNLSKELLSKTSLEYVYNNIVDVSKYLDKFSEQTGNQRTIPLIFKDSTFLGGYSELEKYINKNFTLELVEDF